jgi:hypothetical protein
VKEEGKEVIGLIKNIWVGSSGNVYTHLLLNDGTYSPQ